MEQGNIGRGAGAGAATVALKSSFEISSKVEAIYRGGKVTLSEDGCTVFCACAERLNIVDVKSGAVNASLLEDEDELSCFVVTPDEKFVVSAGKSLLLRQWDLETSSVSRKWKSLHRGPILAMVFDATSTLLATGSSDSTIKVWDIIKQYCTHNLTGSQGVISMLAFHPDEDKLQLISAASDCNIRLWSLKESRCSATFEGHFSTVTSVTFTADKKFMISTARDKVLIFWDLDLRKQLKTIPVFESIESVAMIPREVATPFERDSSKQYLIIGGEKGLLSIRSFPDGKCVLTQPLWPSEKDSPSYSQPSITSLMLSAESLQLAVTTFDHNVIFYDLATLKQQKQMIGNYDEVLDVKFLGSEEELVAIATNSDQIKVLNRTNLDCKILAGHSETVLALDVNVNGQLIASCSKDNTIRLWKLNEEGSMQFSCVAVGQGHTHAVSAVSWPKVKSSFVMSASQDLTIKTWDVPSCFQGNGCHSLIVKWTERAHDKDINAITVSPNDKLLATASQDRTAKIWKASSGDLLATLRGHKRGVWCIVFSPVDQCVATSSGDATVRIWTLSDFTCVKTFEEHTNSVLRVSFLSSGMQLISSGSDGLIKLWTIRSNDCVDTFDAHTDKIWALAVSKKEDVIVSGGADALLNIWKDVTEDRKQAQEEKREESLLQEQELSNLLQQKKFTQAVRLALTLEQPYRVLGIFKDMLKEGDGDSKIEAALMHLRQDHLDALLKFSCDWNTNAKHCLVSQTVLSILLRVKSPDELQQFDQIKERLESLLPYTERHFERMNRLLRQSTFLDYTLQCMKLAALPKEKETTGSHPTPSLDTNGADTAETDIHFTVSKLPTQVENGEGHLTNSEMSTSLSPRTIQESPSENNDKSTNVKKSKKKRLADVTNSVAESSVSVLSLTKSPAKRRKSTRRIVNKPTMDA